MYKGPAVQTSVIKYLLKNGDYILQQICIILLKEGPLQNLGEDAKNWYLIQLNIV